MRVAMFQEIISPYRIPVFNEIHARGKVDFKVIFLSETQHQRQWPVYRNEIRFPYEVLRGIRFEGENLRAIHVNPGVLFQLIRQKFDVIVTGGWQQPAYYLALLYAKLAGKKFLYWSESHAKDARKPGIWRDYLRGGFVRWSSGGIVPGKASRDYLVSLGADDAKIWTAPNAVDTAFYARLSQPIRREKKRLKKEKGFPQKLILYSGRLVREKGVVDLMEAYAKVAEKDDAVGLLLCGEGKCRTELEDFCKGKDLNKVFFAGFVSREDLAFYYGLSDVLVLPSHSEPWGLVVNEAMSCGLPVVCSKNVGAAPDLVRHGENGFVYKPGDTSSLAGYLELILMDELKMEEFGRRSESIVQNHTPARCAQGILQAVTEVCR